MNLLWLIILFIVMGIIGFYCKDKTLRRIDEFKPKIK
jgi:hypothetical protein